MQKSLTALLLICCANTSIASTACVGALDFMFITRAGFLEIYSPQLYGSSEGRTICNMNSTWKTVTPETCKIWYSTILTQAAQSKPLRINYLAGETENCSTVATYNDAVAPFGLTYSQN